MELPSSGRQLDEVDLCAPIGSCAECQLTTSIHTNAYTCNWDPTTSLCSTMTKPRQDKWPARLESCTATDANADLCQASLSYTRTSLNDMLAQGEEVFFSIGKEYRNGGALQQVPELQYCRWEFYLRPMEKYTMAIKRGSDASEVLELEIEGSKDREDIKDYRLQYDPQMDENGWNIYSLTNPEALTIHALTLKENYGPTFEISVKMSSPPSMSEVASVLISVMMLIFLLVSCCLFCSCFLFCVRNAFWRRRRGSRRLRHIRPDEIQIRVLYNNNNGNDSEDRRLSRR